MSSRVKSNTNNIICLGIVLLSIALIYCFCCRYSDMSYHTNDDSSIQNYLSGFTSGNNDPAHQFISIFLGYPLSLLYKQFPHVQWWFVYSQGMMAVGASITLFGIIKLGYAHKTKRKIALFLVLFFLLIFIAPAIASTSFTIVPAVLGVGIITIIFVLGGQKKHKILIIACCLCLLLLSFFHRKQTGIVVLAYCLLALLYVLIKHHGSLKQAVLRWVCYFCVILTLLTMLSQWNNDYKESLDGKEFVAFNKSRSEFMDYPIDTYDENPLLYQDAGWTRDTYLMAKSWCFVDERINAESLHYIHENSKASYAPLSTELKKIWGYGKTRTMIVGFFFSMLGIIVILFMMASRLEIVFGIFDCLLTFSFLAYQLIGRRVFYRTIVIVLLPAFVLMAMLVLNSTVREMRVRSTIRAKLLSVIVLFIFSMSLYNAVVLVNKHVCVKSEAIEKIKEKDDIINKYYIEHSNNIYITHVGLKDNTNPTLIYPNMNIANSIAWGGSTFKNHVFKKQLKNAGIVAINRDVFLRDNVFLVTNVDNESMHPDPQVNKKMEDNEFYAFSRFMKEKYPNIVFVKIDTICDGVYVYKAK